MSNPTRSGTQNPPGAPDLANTMKLLCRGGYRVAEIKHFLNSIGIQKSNQEIDAAPRPACVAQVTEAQFLDAGYTQTNISEALMKPGPDDW